MNFKYQNIFCHDVILITILHHNIINNLLCYNIYTLGKRNTYFIIHKTLKRIDDKYDTTICDI